MQTFSLDFSVKKIIPLLHAKQGDVGRKFKVTLTDSGSPYSVPAGATVSVWFSGASGEGNYTDIGAESAVSISGNEITVELITQMLTNPGTGVVCLVINAPNGDELGVWNIIYVVEPRPGMNSEEANAYFTAFSQAVANLPYPDASLTAVGKAAESAAVGLALAEKAPAGYGLGKNINEMPTANDANDCVKNGWYKLIIGTANGIGAQGIMRVDAEGDANIVQTAYAGYSTSRGMVIMQRVKHQGTWGEWEYVTPLCVSGEEYRTTERLDGVPVYCKVISFGTLPNSTFKNVAHGITGKVRNVRYEISTISTARMFANYPGITDIVVDGTNVKITTDQNMSDISVLFALWYTKG